MLAAWNIDRCWRFPGDPDWGKPCGVSTATSAATPDVSPPAPAPIIVTPAPRPPVVVPVVTKPPAIAITPAQGLLPTPPGAVAPVVATADAAVPASWFDQEYIPGFKNLYLLFAGAVLVVLLLKRRR